GLVKIEPGALSGGATHRDDSGVAHHSSGIQRRWPYHDKATVADVVAPPVDEPTTRGHEPIEELLRWGHLARAQDLSPERSGKPRGQVVRVRSTPRQHEYRPANSERLPLTPILHRPDSHPKLIA